MELFQIPTQGTSTHPFYLNCIDMSLININLLNTEFFSGRIIIIKAPQSTQVEYDENGNIVSLTMWKDTKVEVGDEVDCSMPTIPSYYKISSISELNSHTPSVRRFELFCGIKTKVESYLLPALYIKKKYTPDTMMLDVYFLGAFVDLEGRNLVLAYRYSRADLYKELEKLLIEHPSFLILKTINYIDYYHFHIDENLTTLFMQGKYSKFPNEHNTKVVLFYGLNKKSFIHQVLYKGKELKREIESRLEVSLGDEIELDSVPKMVDFVTSEIAPFGNSC